MRHPVRLDVLLAFALVMLAEWVGQHFFTLFVSVAVVILTVWRWDMTLRQHQKPGSSFLEKVMITLATWTCGGILGCLVVTSWWCVATHGLFGVGGLAGLGLLALAAALTYLFGALFSRYVNRRWTVPTDTGH